MNTANQVKQDFNSSKNQEIKGNFVSKEIYCNVNSMVDYILSKSFEDNNTPFTYDDILNYYEYPEFYGKYAQFEGGNEDDRQTEIARLQILIDDIDSDDITEDQTEINNDIESLENLESEPSEIYEWYKVSSWLCEKLKEQGQCVIEDENLWGRCTTGQAILLDGVISRICSNLEILEGQKNQW